jgi:hypothetical protein
VWKTKKIYVISEKHALVNQKFYPLTASADSLTFTFQSLSTDKTVQKEIQFIKITDKLYNLAFGDLQMNDEIDDLVVTNNKDTELVLATVIQAIQAFLQSYSQNAVYFTGSTPSRTRLYRIILNREYVNWCDVFEVYGVLGDKIVPFETNVRFKAFIVKMREV